MTVIRLALTDLLRTLKSSKTVVIVLLCFFFFWNETIELRGLAEYYQIGITTYVYPIFMTNWRSRMYALVLILMMLGEAPYYNGSEVFTSMRISKYKWLTSKLIYIFLLSVLFQIVMMIIAVVVCLPYVGVSNDWGDVIITHMNSIQGMTSSLGSVNSDGILSIQPMMAMMYEFILMTLISTFLALLMFVLNGVLKNIVGTIFVGSVVIVDLYISEVESFGLIKRNLSFSLPTTWIDLNAVLMVENFSFMKCILYLFLLIVMLVAFTYILVGKRVIKPVTNV